MQGNVDLKYGTDKDSSFIVRYFEDFYGEIIRQKAAVMDAPQGDIADEENRKHYKNAATSSVQDAPPSIQQQTSQSGVIAERIIQKLVAILNSQALDSARYGGEFASKYYKEAQFIMAALADEIFLHMEWSGKDYWEKNLLEDRLYGTHNAGQLFFDRIDEFLSNRDVSRADLAILYLMTLGLGFKGKFRNQDDQGRLAYYRRELYIFAYHKDPTLFELGTRLCPEVYQHTIDDNRITFLNDARPWMYIFIATAIVMLLLSYMVWDSTTNNIDQLTSSILSQSEHK